MPTELRDEDIETEWKRTLVPARAEADDDATDTGDGAEADDDASDAADDDTTDTGGGDADTTDA